ncbi:hypothetical protein TNCV_431141 [Trichonephila clavipes]|nr:hypothetical protein TNCV_431141 [Trichonephila clavipes]
MVIRSEGAVEYVMVGVSRRPTQAIWRGKEIEPVQCRYQLGAWGGRPGAVELERPGLAGLTLEFRQFIERSS